MYEKNSVSVKHYNQEIVMKNLNQEVDLPSNIKNEINEYWKKLISEKPWFTRGIIYEVFNMKEKHKTVEIFLKQSDYAHYMYGNNVNKHYKCKNCWAGVLLETSDNYYALGETNAKTESPGEIRIIGGLLDNSDINNEYIDICNTAKRELLEEVGINLDDNLIANKIKDKYIISEGERKSVGIIFKVKLKISKEELEENYKRFVEKLKMNNEEIELKKLIFIKKDIDEIEQWLNSRENYIEYIPNILNVDLR